MKHPVDTSQWGEFLLKDIATLTNGNKFDKNKMSHDNPSINFVSRTGFNNGISDFVDKIEGAEPYPAGAITLALGGSVGSTFVQPQPFYTGQNVGVIEFENKSEKMKQFIAVVLNKVCSTQFSAFKNEINKHFKRDLAIPLPLKPSADPENYTQDDIDWDYMDMVMSRVTTRAKERLANLPQPTDKKKTPVDTSAWGEFVVGELFDMIQDRRLKKADFIEGDIPYVMASSYNNGVITYISNPITTGENLLTADIFGNVFYQSSFIGFGDDNCGLKLKNHKATKYQYLFLATVFKKFQNEASFTNKLRGSWYIQQTFPLPLKPSEDPSNYTQEDIDWDYMDSFMQAIEEKAHKRVASLRKQI